MILNLFHLLINLSGCCILLFYLFLLLRYFYVKLVQLQFMLSVYLLVFIIELFNLLTYQIFLYSEPFRFLFFFFNQELLVDFFLLKILYCLLFSLHD